MAEKSTAMQQYDDIKKKYNKKNEIVFFQIGKFYEIFYDDAVKVVEALGIKMTKRRSKKSEIPMCGVPVTAHMVYVSSLIGLGYRVVICNQVEGSKDGGLIKRKVVQVHSSGTYIDDASFDNNFLAFIDGRKDIGYGLAYVDVAVGHFIISTFEDAKGVIGKLYRINPAEIMTTPYCDALTDLIKSGMNPDFFEPKAFEYEAASKNLNEQFGAAFRDMRNFASEFAVNAGGALIQYLKDTQEDSLEHINKIQHFKQSNFMYLDKSAFVNLELRETMRERKSIGSFFNAIDETKSTMGRRLLRNWMENPVLCIREIALRQGAVAELKDRYIIRGEIRDELDKMIDIERMVTKILYRSTDYRDFASLAKTIEFVVIVKKLLEIFRNPLLNSFYEEMDTLDDVHYVIKSALSEEAYRDKGFPDEVYDEGHDKYLDEIRERKKEAEKQMEALLQRERTQLGIKSLKVKRDEILGHYFEVPNEHYDKAPRRFMHLRAYAHVHLYTSDELKVIAQRLLIAENEKKTRERELFVKMQRFVGMELARVQDVGRMMAKLDCLCSLAEIAHLYNYICPHMHLGRELEIINGRHPVLERYPGEFTANDILFDDNNKMVLLTGPNMSGKSTYLRQVGLICIMAQMGSFVPASSAKLPIIDKILARVEVQDDPGAGKSTFMMEMLETAEVLANANQKSLILLDEVGKNTDSQDGVCLSMAIIEYIANVLNTKTLFATHYRELADAEDRVHGVNSFMMEIEEKDGKVNFLRKVVRGRSEKAHGIHVAEMAGLPEAVIKRAKELADRL